MFGNTALTAAFGAAVDTSSADSMAGYVRALADMGLPVLLIAPGAKRPIDMRTQAEKGDSPAGVHLATTDKALLKKYVTRAYKDPSAKRPKGHPAPVGSVNVAVRLAGSGYVVADADTPAEVAALQAWLAQGGVASSDIPAPTVSTPGSSDQSHHGGGHWWFRLPASLDVDMSAAPAVRRIDVDMPDGTTGGFSLYMGNAYVLVPPSARPEGPYSLVSPDTAAPACLVDEIVRTCAIAVKRDKARQDYAERLAQGTTDVDSQVAQWSAATDWEDILAPAGWADTGAVDSCGCPIWTAPGVHSSPKSATAHTAECGHGRIDPTNPPLHVWTDNPGDELADHIATRGTKTVSKLTVFALLHHGGDMAAAMDAAGIDQAPTGQAVTDTLTASGGADMAALDASTGVAAGNVLDTLDAAPVAAMPGGWQAPRDYDALAVDTVQAATGLEMWNAWQTQPPATEQEAAALLGMLPPFGSLAAYSSMPAPVYTVDGYIEQGGLCSIIGASGIGKSGVVLDMAACIATGTRWHGRKTVQTPVLYIAGEGVAGAVSRLKAWQRATGVSIPDTSFYVVGDAMLFGSPTQAWAALARQIRAAGIGVVIFDTLARMSTGLDENSATDMNKAVRLFDRLRSTTGAGVVYVHHTARGTTHGRGSTALLGAVDSEVLVTDTLVDGKPFGVNEDNQPVDSDGNVLPGAPLCVQVTKQKNSQDGAYMYLCRTSKFDSLVITDLEGNAASAPFGQAGSVEVGQSAAESVEDTAARVVEYVAKYTSGIKLPTITDIRAGVAPDRARAGMPASAWRDAINLAVDHALATRALFKHGAGYSTDPFLEE